MTWSGSEDPSARDMVSFELIFFFRSLDGLLVVPRPCFPSLAPLTFLSSTSSSSLLPLSQQKQIGLFYSSALPPAPSEPIKFVDAARDPNHLSRGSGRAVFLVNNLRWNVTAAMTNKVCLFLPFFVCFISSLSSSFFPSIVPFESTAGAPSPPAAQNENKTLRIDLKNNKTKNSKTALGARRRPGPVAAGLLLLAQRAAAAARGPRSGPDDGGRAVGDGGRLEAEGEVEHEPADGGGDDESDNGDGGAVVKVKQQQQRRRRRRPPAPARRRPLRTACTA